MKERRQSRTTLHTYIDAGSTLLSLHKHSPWAKLDDVDNDPSTSHGIHDN